MYNVKVKKKTVFCDVLIFPFFMGKLKLFFRSCLSQEHLKNTHRKTHFFMRKVCIVCDHWRLKAFRAIIF